MSKVVKLINVFVLLLVVFTGYVFGGVPLVNLEGVGGVAFNPLAYLANPVQVQDDEDLSEISKLIGKPQLGVWYVDLGDVGVDWTSFGFAQTLFDRLELSYGREVIASDGFETITKNNFGAKYLLFEENSSGNNWFPAISIGAIGKHTKDNPYKNSANVKSSGYDIYIVATKLSKDFYVPTLVSGGLIYTNSRATGVFGYADDFSLRWFGNVDFVLTEDVAVGFEYKQGASYDGWEDADYWETHLAWFVNPDTTLVLAYVNAGNHESSSEVGLGDGLVLSLQYAF